MSVATVTATGEVAAPAEAVFRLLGDLDAHRTLAAPHIEILQLYGRPGARSGGLVRLRGPLGIRLTARTRVRAARFPSELSGTAEAARGTTATISWRLEPQEGATRLRAELRVDSAHPGHRLLLGLGGRRWLQRRLATGLDRLAADVVAV